ncbi:type II toxin-antitoxin system VapC family toxin [Sphingomonas sp. LaA6.9]|uniref:type II toxin-antitoxin system VapC family toxin n=1 Tax=Sphingomonas sp. LaA6.9 TaxID=2919914 RepID=UPI001F4FC95B|nr:type II toxin-antitoxin system VapC family toxin [Sphingomonas sp. LaA6.9]MCJ8157841.1 type II toxin-antitoxin system VapC family toxin [Sphingomonas sp. LaA6.9]
MIKYLIDADAAIYAMAESHSPLTARMEQCAPGDIAISAISFAEIALGTHNGKPPLSGILDAFLAAIPMLPFDEPAAREYARLPFRRARFDRLLAAHALSIGATVITNNEDDFADVPGLKIENWSI